MIAIREPRMAFSDRVILPILRHLMTTMEYCTYQDIAEAADVPWRTVARAIPRLVSAGQIRVIDGGRGIGTKYGFADGADEL